ncbi:MAG TPA: TIGR03086 family metal-binding protein [Nocardioidaceae bacterium]|nr:TIGR03086 family metal-binding protein [Nocardioidaceae bacterium]
MELLERAIAYTRGSLALVRADLMAAPTPCAGWDLHALLLHMHDSLASLDEAGSARVVHRATPPAPPVDLVDSLRVRACRLLAEWSTDWAADPRAARSAPAGSLDILVDGRPVTSSVLTSAGALEIAVHGWDVAVACGDNRPLPDELAADLLLLAPVLVTAVDRPTRFAAARPSRPGCSPGERLLAFLGRAPR